MDKIIIFIDTILILLITQQIYNYYNRNSKKPRPKKKCKHIKLKSAEYFAKKRETYPSIIFQTWKTRKLPKNFKV